MNKKSGNALKNGRKSSLLNIISAALKLNLSDRQLSKYENGEVKEKDPQVFLNAMKLYNDIKVGFAYLEEDPVFEFLFGNISLTENTLRAATKYVAESDGNQINPQVLLNWGLKEGQESLSDIIIRKLRATMHSTMDLYFNIRQRDGFAY